MHTRPPAHCASFPYTRAEAWEKVCKSTDFEALFDRLGATVGTTGAPDGVEIRFECMRKQTNTDGTALKFTFQLRDAQTDDDNGVAVGGRTEHTGFEDAGYPDDLGGEDDTADRISNEEAEEIEDDGDEEHGNGDDDDIPSSEDEDADEDLAPFPESLKKKYQPVPAADDAESMRARLKPGTMVAIFYIDETEWEVGTVKKMNADGTGLVQFLGLSSKYVYAFDDDDYGENGIWVIVTKVEAEEVGRTKTGRTGRAGDGGSGSGGAGAAGSAAGAGQAARRASAGDAESASGTEVGGRASRANLAAESEQRGNKRPGSADGDTQRKAARTSPNELRCAYEKCLALNPTADLVGCTSRGCVVKVHHCCFIASHAELAEAKPGARLCHACASDVRS